MKRIYIMLTLAVLLQASAFAQSSRDSLSWKDAAWEWTQLDRGAMAGYCQVPLFGCMQSISVVKYPARKFRTSFVHAPAQSSDITSTLAEKSDAAMALNGSYFNVRELTPVTFFSIRHKIIGRTTREELFRTDGVLCLKNASGKKMEIVPYDSTLTEQYRKRYYASLASGPILLHNGEAPEFDMSTSFSYKRHPRTFFGWNSKGEVFMVVVDGRFPGQGDGASIPELAAIARLLGLEEAINLDGGGSSTVWTEKTGVINHPYDNHRFDHEGQRVVPNILIAR